MGGGVGGEKRGAGRRLDKRLHQNFLVLVRPRQTNGSRRLAQQPPGTAAPVTSGRCRCCCFVAVGGPGSWNAPGGRTRESNEIDLPDFPQDLGLGACWLGMCREDTLLVLS